MILKSNLDKRICDVEHDAANTQTYREFIRQSEEEFGINHVDLDKFDDKKLNDYLESLDYLWTK